MNDIDNFALGADFSLFSSFDRKLHAIDMTDNQSTPITDINDVTHVSISGNNGICATDSHVYVLTLSKTEVITPKILFSCPVTDFTDPISNVYVTPSGFYVVCPNDVFFAELPNESSDETYNFQKLLVYDDNNEAHLVTKQDIAQESFVVDEEQTKTNESQNPTQNQFYEDCTFMIKDDQLYRCGMHNDSLCGDSSGFVPVASFKYGCALKDLDKAIEEYEKKECIVEEQEGNQHNVEEVTKEVEVDQEESIEQVETQPTVDDSVTKAVEVDQEKSTEQVETQPTVDDSVTKAVEVDQEESTEQVETQPAVDDSVTKEVEVDQEESTEQVETQPTGEDSSSCSSWSLMSFVNREIVLILY
ncbi:hypothetical protein P9112_008410 [Eukaryota sp. TZLM1-RC]